MEAAVPELVNESVEGVRVYRVYTRDSGYKYLAVDDNRNVIELK